MRVDRSRIHSLPALATFGRYELLGRLALGGMAEIYLAREPATIEGSAPRHLVIKRILPHVAQDPSFLRMFRDEAQIAMMLRHPSIVHLYEFGQEADSLYLAMEWIDGIALSHLIRTASQSAGMPAPIAVKIASHVAQALHYAHELKSDHGRPLNIVHRDVSPQNVMITTDGAIKLLDFGVAKTSVQRSETQEGQVKGKFAYMAPEQCVAGPLDRRVDVFSLGVVLFESLTGKPLYHRGTQFETMRAVVEGPVPSLREVRPDVDLELAAIVERALAKSPDDRFPTAGEFQVALELWLSSKGHIVPDRRIARYALDGRDEPSRSYAIPVQALAKQAESGVEIPIDIDDSRMSLPPLLTDLADRRPLSSNAPESPSRRYAIAILSVLGLALLGAASGWFVRGLRSDQADTANPSIAFVSNPPGALVFVDDERIPGTTPIVLGDREPRTYDVRIMLNGYEAWQDDVDVSTTDARVEVVLVPLTELPAVSSNDAAVTRTQPVTDVASPVVADDALPEGVGATVQPSSGRRETELLSVNTSPWSRVYIGQRFLGSTPLGNAEVPTGSLRLRFEDRDGRGHIRSVSVVRGQPNRFFFDFNENPE